jgi:hypothetical protein
VDAVLAPRCQGDFPCRTRYVRRPRRLLSPWRPSAWPWGCCPKIAWDGQHYRLTFVAQSLLSARLARDGSLLEKEPVVTLRSNLGTGIRFAHSVTAAPRKGMLVVCTRSQPDYWGWGGPGAMICLLVGADGKPDAGLPKESYPQTELGNSDVIASRVDGWKPLDDAGVPVAASPLEERRPALASDGAGKLLCVYERHDGNGRVCILARLLHSQ